MNNRTSRARSVVFCGLTIALITVCAWITFPVGIVPVTLQVFAVIFALMFLAPKEFFLSLAVYLLLGAIGLPVFSGMRGGLGMLLGPTGGFLWGYLIGGGAVVLMRVISGTIKSSKKKDKSEGERKELPIFVQPSMKSDYFKRLAEAGVFLVLMYLCGWIQLMLVAGLGPGAAFLAGVAPFIIIDVIKAIGAVTVANAVKRALRVS